MEEERKWKFYDIAQLKQCITFLDQANKSLIDVDDISNFYEEIQDLREKINDLKIKKEAEL